MAREYAGDVKRGDMPKANPLDLVLLPSDNTRYEWQGKTLDEILTNPPQSVEDMLASMLEDGQKQPVCGHPVAGNKIKIHAGFNRTVAAMLLRQRGLRPDFRIDVRLEDCNEKEAVRASVVENAKRTDTTRIDDMAAVQKLRRHGYMDLEIREMFGTKEKPMSNAWLGQIDKLLMLDDGKRMAIHTRQMAARAGVRLAEIEDPELREQVLEDAKKEADGAPVTEEHVMKHARKRGAVTKKVQLSFVAVKEFWKVRTLPGNNHPRIQRLAKLHMQYIASEMDEKSFERELVALFGTR